MQTVKLGFRGLFVKMEPTTPLPFLTSTAGYLSRFLSPGEKACMCIKRANKCVKLLYLKCNI